MNPNSQPRRGSLGTRRGVLLAGALPVLLLLPFLNKAWHIDDTVYLYVAEQILSAPLDFYGFEMNWGQIPKSVAVINKNPPGVSYFIAAVAAVAGWREWAHHLALLVPVFLAGAGTYRLAARFTPHPLVAALAATLTPAFLVSSSNVMCEPVLLAFYVWAVERWTSGLATGRKAPLIAAGILIGLGTLTKYLVLTAVPLLAAYTLAYERRLTYRTLYLLIPFLFIAVYDAYYTVQYGLSAWLGSGSFALRTAGTSGSSEAAAHALINFAFLGGAFITPFALTVLGHRRVAAFAFAVAVAVAAYVLGRGGLDGQYGLYADGAIRWGYLTQMALFIAAGAGLMLAAFAQLARYRDAAALLILLWIGGMFVFCGYVNWSINVRALLPAAPAIGMLAARALVLESRAQRAATAAILAVGAAVSLAVLYGDYRNAETGRRAGGLAAALRSEGAVTDPAPNRLLFQGHLGFQWYMERAGYRHIVVGETPEGGHMFATLADYGFENSDLCAVKGDAAIIDLTASDCRLVEEVPPADVRWVAVMNREAGAGFYTAYTGELPYYFGAVTPERITFYQVVDARASTRE